VLHLPIDPHLPAIAAALREHKSLVLVAEPGAGKTTRVPPALMAAGLTSGEHPAIVMLQPRRVAARAAAARIADETGSTLGQQVGYHIRFEKRLTPNTRIRVLTEGILTRQLLDDPFLSGVGCVILDEFHERSIHIDLCLALLAEVRATVRPDLHILVMSATLDAEPVAAFLGGCPILRVPGRVFPVDTLYDHLPSSDPAEYRAASAIEHALEKHEGDLLAFFPGAGEINRAAADLSRRPLAGQPLILPLHGSLPFEEQKRVLEPSARRRVILATNIAETSLTIDGVRIVVDTGLHRSAGFDPRRGMDTLRLARISKASAEQRRGRAGRTAPGVCYRLWTAKQHAALDDFDLPEVRRVDLSPTILLLRAWGATSLTACWYEPPAQAAIDQATRLLQQLDALDEVTLLTDLGRQLSSIPAHPRIARLLLAGQQDPQTAADIAAILSEEDFQLRDRDTRSPTTAGPSDLDHRLHLLHQCRSMKFSDDCRSIGADPQAARRVARAAEQLAQSIPRSSIANRKSQIENKSLALLAFPDRLALRRATDTATLIDGSGIKLAPESAVRTTTTKDYPYLLALDVRQDDRPPNPGQPHQRSEATVRLAIALTLQDIEQAAPHHLTRSTRAVYDAEKDRLVGQSVLLYLGFPLKIDEGVAVTPDTAAAAILDYARPRLRELLEKSEPATTLLARLDMLQRHMPEHPWPMVDDAFLQEAAASASPGCRTLDDLVTRLPTAIHDSLPYPLPRLLDEHAPTHLTVPTGNRIRITYHPTNPPVLPVRLQELFGQLDTPRIAAGRVPVVLHLLSPGYKPVQVTTDLRSFWTNTYDQVRKDLRARYPKHSWPDDPFTAAPVAKGRPTRS
jgi:ATP-dependent helicase HrpB